VNHATNAPKYLERSQGAYERRLYAGGKMDGATMTDEQAVDFHRALLASGKNKPPVS
jgi:hypothetical protein